MDNLQYTVRCRPTRAFGSTVMGKVMDSVSLVTCNLVLVVPVGSPTYSTAASPGNSVRVVRSTFNSVGYPCVVVAAVILPTIK